MHSLAQIVELRSLITTQMKASNHLAEWSALNAAIRALRKISNWDSNQLTVLRLIWWNFPLFHESKWWKSSCKLSPPWPVATRSSCPLPPQSWPFPTVRMLLCPPRWPLRSKRRAAISWPRAPRFWPLWSVSGAWKKSARKWAGGNFQISRRPGRRSRHEAPGNLISFLILHPFNRMEFF